jgi:hypothetical protein
MVNSTNTGPEILDLAKVSICLKVGRLSNMHDQWQEVLTCVTSGEEEHGSLW